MIFRNFLFYLGLVPATLLFAILGTLFFFLPFKARYYLITRWSHFFIFWAKITCGLRYKVTGKENIPTKNAIIFANHQSMWETIFMQVLFPTQSWVLKKELLKIPVFGWGLALLDPIAIDRKQFNSVKALIQQGFERLQKGRWVVIFPEGTRVAPNMNRPYSRSGAALAEATGYPILPVAHNAGLYWPRGFFIKKPGTIQVVIGPIIESKEKTATVLNKEAEHWIRETLETIVK
ncbi:MAG TPA: lysophospholipid acyltransferase family protein [Gammaproteobacteria bacterium]|nr:lysophospholipid acyltransferase family protein [Gammaproteobacteria bacterium]